jgi:putative FmdB family regulatory protein
MPVYDYLCDRCGPFTEMKPMAEADLRQKCPTCRRKAPRAFLTAPYLATSGRGPIWVTGEPGALGKPLSAAHRSGCNCCSGSALRYNKRRAQ